MQEKLRLMKEAKAKEEAEAKQREEEKVCNR
jgi:hypothetical protein